MSRPSMLLLLLLPLLLKPADALACACCAEPGTWYQRSTKISGDTIGELDRLAPAETARLYLTAAGAEGVKGLALPEESLSQPFTVALTRAKTKWTFVFNDVKGERGALVFTLPAKLGDFGVDQRDGAGQGEVQLYKEWRIDGHVWGNGFFKKGVTPDLKFRLVLQGRGNMCASAEDFKHWRLEVWGPRAAYAFYGDFKAPAAP